MLLAETSPPPFSLFSINFFDKEEKEKNMKVLALDLMSSEETGSASASGSESSEKERIFLTRPLPWRSPAANNLMESLDRKIIRHRSERAKEMRLMRRIGDPSSRPMSENQGEAWAMNAMN